MIQSDIFVSKIERFLRPLYAWAWIYSNVGPDLLKVIHKIDIDWIKKWKNWIKWMEFEGNGKYVCVYIYVCVGHVSIFSFFYKIKL